MNQISEFEKFKAKCHDPLQLADMVNGWRNHMGLTMRAAAEMLDISPRTLEGIEYGRGFRYPLILTHAMIYAECIKDQKREVPDGLSS